MQWRRVIRVTAIVLTALVVPVAVGAVGIAGVRGEIYTPRDATAPPVSVEAAAIPAHDPTKPTAVVVLSVAGTNIADALPPTRSWLTPGRSTSTPSQSSVSRCR
jgi:hypothetical protein